MKADDIARMGLTGLREALLAHGGSVEAEVLEALEKDPRAGARKLAATLRQRQTAGGEDDRLSRMSEHEGALWARGLLHVAGVDEVGAGCLAGPVMAAAVIVPVGWRCPGINDSKALTADKRERLVPLIEEGATAWAIGRVEPEEIDRLNILNARFLAMRRALESLRIEPQHVLVDGNQKLRDLKPPQTAIVKGDSKCISIAAASILAKVARDALMVELDARYPGYGFAEHKGYPSPEHKEALRRLGPTDLHRRSFAPVAETKQGTLDFGT